MRQINVIFRQVLRVDFSNSTNIRRMSTTLNFKDALSGPFNFVDNRRCDPVDASTEGTFDNIEPRSGLKLSEVKISGQQEVDRVVKTAKLAGNEWSKVRWKYSESRFM